MKLRRLAKLYRAARSRAWFAKRQGDYQGAAYAQAEASRLRRIMAEG